MITILAIAAAAWLLLSRRDEIEYRAFKRGYEQGRVDTIRRHIRSSYDRGYIRGYAEGEDQGQRMADISGQTTNV